MLAALLGACKTDKASTCLLFYSGSDLTTPGRCFAQPSVVLLNRCSILLLWATIDAFELLLLNEGCVLGFHAHLLLGLWRNWADQHIRHDSLRQVLVCIRRSLDVRGLGFGLFPGGCWESCLLWVSAIYFIDRAASSEHLNTVESFLLYLFPGILVQQLEGVDTAADVNLLSRLLSWGESHVV